MDQLVLWTIHGPACMGEVDDSRLYRGGSKVVMTKRLELEGCAMENQETTLASTLPDLSESEKQQKIAALAYEFWLARNFRNGSPATDWLRADQQVWGRTATGRLRRTPVGLFLMTSPCS
jgi:hypothetical protein